MVDRGPVPRRVLLLFALSAVRAMPARSGPAGRGDLLHRLVYHRGRVLDLPEGRRGPQARGRPGGGSSSSSPGPGCRLVGHRRAAGRDHVLQRQRGGDDLRPVRAGRAPAARVAARCLRLGPFLGRQRAGLVQYPRFRPSWRPRSSSWWIGLHNLTRVPSPSACPPSPATWATTGQIHNAELTNLGTFVGALFPRPGAAPTRRGHHPRHCRTWNMRRRPPATPEEEFSVVHDGQSADNAAVGARAAG